MPSVERIYCVAPLGTLGDNVREDTLNDSELDQIEEELIDVDVTLMTVYDEILQNQNRSGYVHFSKFFTAWQERSSGQIEVKLFKVGGEEFYSWQDIQLAALAMPGVRAAHYKFESKVSLPIKGKDTFWSGDYPCMHFVIDLNEAQTNEPDRLAVLNG